MFLRPLSELESSDVSWLWPGRLALGKLALLDGDPGLGKSLLALDLCARLSTGRPMPDGSPGPGVSNSLVLNAEDSEQDTIRPRLLALGADLERIFVLRLGEDPGELLRLPTHTAMLEEALKQTRARLVVLDPIVAFLDRTVCCHSDQSVRGALGPLKAVAEKSPCVVALVRHLNKQEGGRSLYRGGGSIGFQGACRSTWLVGADPTQPGRRVLAQVKNNLGPPQPSLAFALEGEPGAAPRLSWLGTSPLTSDELLAGAAGPGKKQPHELACDFLAEFLGEGPRTSREIWEAARKRGLTVRTLFRARKEMEVQVQLVQDRTTRLNYWLLPGQNLSVEDANSLEEFLAPLREKYPPSTPLDDL
jgi:hypothetical protein